MLLRAVAIACLSIVNPITAAEPTLLPGGFTEHINALAGNTRGTPVRLRGNEVAETKATFKPPVEFIIEAKTNSTDLCTTYAETTIRLNDGRQPKTGPKSLNVRGPNLRAGITERDKGAVPANKYATLRWVVTANHISFSVNGEERFSRDHDFSKADSTMMISTGSNAEVMVKSIKARSLAEAR